MKKTTRILLVDDDSDLLQAYSEILHTQGYEVWEAASGREGLRVTRERRPDLVLLDVMLPDLSGIEVCRRIKADATLPDVFVVLFSGMATNSTHKVEGLAAGADDYLVKRVDPEEFLARIRMIARVQETTAGLRASQQHYRQLVEILPEAVLLVDLQMRVLTVNPRGVAMLGCTSPAELLGKSAFDLTPPEDHDRIRADIATALTKGMMAGAEQTLIRSGGQRFPAEFSAAVSTDACGQPAGFVFVGRDISERIRVEKRNAAFSHLGYRLSAASTREQAADIILDIGSELFGWDAGYVTLYSPEQDQIIPLLTVDMVEGERVRFPPTSWPPNPSPLMRRVMKEGAQLLNPSRESRQTLNLVHFGNPDRRSVSMMFVPIHAKGAVIGVLSIQSYTSQAYSQADLQLLQTLADYCGDALERIRVTEALREAEAKYRSIVENATEGIFQTTPDGHYRSANLALARMLGYQTPEELIAGVTDLERQTYVKPERRQELLRLLETEGSVHGFEFEHYHKDGSTIWVSISGHAVRDSSGTIQYYEGTIQDITERQRAEVVLRESEEKFRTLFESAPIGTALHDANGRYVQTNSAYQQMLGYTGEELRQLGVKRVTYPDDIAEAQRLFAEMRDGKRDHYRREKRYRAKDGHLVWAQSSACAVRDGAGRLQYIVSMVEDITERKQIHEALERAQRQQQAILSNIPDPAWLKDTAGHFLACNEALARTYGQSPEAILGQTVSAFVPAIADTLIRQDQEVVQSRRPVMTEVPLTDAQGRCRWFEDVESPVFDEKGEVVGTVGIARDITDRRWAENLLRRQRDFGIFLSSTDDLGAAADRLLKIALENEGLDCGAVYLVDLHTNALELAAQQGLSTDFAKRSPPVAADPLQDQLAGARQATSREPVRPMAVIVQELKREGLLALEAIPIQHSGQVVAVLNVGSRTGAAIPANTLQAIEALAAQAGGAISRIRAEQSMHTSRQVLEKTISSLRVAVFIADAHSSTIQECNPGASRMFGYSREEMIAKAPLSCTSTKRSAKSSGGTCRPRSKRKDS